MAAKSTFFEQLFRIVVVTYIYLVYFFCDLDTTPEILYLPIFSNYKAVILSFSDTKSFDTNFVNVYFIISLRYLDFKILFEFISVSMIKFTNCFKQVTSI